MGHIHHGKPGRRIPGIIGDVNDGHHAGRPQLKYLLVLLCGRLEADGGHHPVHRLTAEIHNGIPNPLQPAFTHILVGKDDIALSLVVDDQTIFLQEQHGLP